MDPGHSSVGRPYRRIVLCADDFGMNSAINAGILDLAGRERLSATSVLVDGPAAAADIAALRQTRLQIGLHLNLTESFGQPGVCLPLRRLIVAAYRGHLPIDEVHLTIQRQIDRFLALVGRAPDYVDGHQHVHQLPGIREALLDSLDLAPGPRPWIRHTGRPRPSGLPLRLRLKAHVIAGLGAARLHTQAQARGYRQNSGFLGVYDFQGGAARYADWMRHWLAACRDGDVLMCHPALGSSDDTISAQREAEHQVLASADMGSWLNAQHLTVITGAPIS